MVGGNTGAETEVFTAGTNTFLTTASSPSGGAGIWPFSVSSPSGQLIGFNVGVRLGNGAPLIIRSHGAASYFPVP